MVKIAIAGGAGNVAQEIIDVLAATKKHDILILTRRDIPLGDSVSGVTWAKTNYEDVSELVNILQGVHTVLSFISPHLDQDQAATVQKNLIDASVQAGVKRFAPSEWASAGLEHMDWYAYKRTTRQYLEELNKDKKVLEYALFQPGLFTNYLTRPYKSANHVKSIETPFDFANRRALVRDGGDDDRITFTTVQDLANVVARAIEYEGEWPVISGIRGTTMSIGRLMALGEEIRGGKFNIDKLKTEELQSGTYTASWMPKLDHPSILPEHLEAASRVIVAGMLLAISKDSFVISDEWNRLLPDYEFVDAEAFLREAWRGKP